MWTKSVLSRFHSIRAQLTFVSVVLVLVLALSIVASGITLFTYFIKQNREITDSMLEIVGESVERRIDALRKLVPLIRDDGGLKQALLEGGDPDAVFEKMNSIYAYGLQHRFLISTDDNIVDPVYFGNRAQTDNALRLAGFYDFLSGGKEERFSAPHQFPFLSPDGDRISFFYRLRDPLKQYREYGYALFIVSIHSLFEDREDLIRSRFDSFFVVDGEGRLIFALSAGKDDPEAREYVLSNYQAFSKADSFSAGGRIYFSSTVHSYSDWRMVGVVTNRAFSQSIYVIMAVVTSIGLIGVLLVFGLSTAIAKNVSGPVTRMNRAMAAFESGQIPEKLEITSMAGEMSTLVTGFNHMLDNIQSHLATIVREQEQKKDAEVAALAYQLQSLQHQINPHFLYNTLNIISFLALDGKSAEIRTFNQSLIALLRATLSNTKDSVPIRSEISFLEAYIEIMAYRYPDSFVVNISVDDGLLESQIPKLILQPLVENAMIHGIVPIERKGHIEVLIEDRGDYINVTVGDDGVGMDMAMVPELLAPRKRFTGIGLSNVNDRLRLCYGEEYGIVISSEPSMGTVIVFKIPKDAAGG